MGTDPSLDYDGGWEELADGGDGVEEIVIGPEQRYDMPHGHVPEPNFATRPVLPGRRPDFDIEEVADVTSLLTSAPSGRPVPPSGAVTSRCATERTNQEARTEAIRAVADRNRMTAKMVQTAVLGNLSNEQRAERINATVAEIHRLRADYSAFVSRAANPQSRKTPSAASSPNAGASTARPHTGVAAVQPEGGPLAASGNARQRRQAQALEAAATAAGVSPAVAAGVIRANGSDRTKASRLGISLQDVKFVRSSYEAALKQVAPKTERRPSRPQNAARTRKNATTGPSLDAYCEACEQAVRGTTCGCS